MPRRRIVPALLVLALLASGGFLAARDYLATPGATAQEGSPTPSSTSPGRDPFWYVPLERSEKTGPRFDGSVGEIRVGPNVDEIDACGTLRGPSATLTQVPIGEASALALEIDPRPAQLPERSTIAPSGVDNRALLCDGVPVFTVVFYEFPPSADSRYGGWIRVVRQRGPATAMIDVAADRVTIFDLSAGRAALAAAPLTDDGFGPSFFVIDEPWGMTFITADGLTSSEVLRAATSLPVAKGD